MIQAGAKQVLRGLHARARVLYHLICAERTAPKCRRAGARTRLGIEQGLREARKLVAYGHSDFATPTEMQQRMDRYRREIHKTHGPVYDTFTSLIHAFLVIDHDVAKHASRRTDFDDGTFRAPVPNFEKVNVEAEALAALFHATMRQVVPDRVRNAFLLYWKAGLRAQAYSYARFAVENPLDGVPACVVQDTSGG